MTVQQVAQLFRVSDHVVYYWIQNAIVQARKLNAGSPYWITLSEMDHQKLRDWVHNSNRIRSASLTHPEGGAL
jgi:transposase-like protein